MKNIIEINNGKIYTYTPYNKDFIGSAKMLGGRWDKKEKSWYFDVDLKREVEDLLYDYFGYGGTTVNVKVTTITDYIGLQEIVINGRTMFKRMYRDSPVKTYVATKGDFDSSGGSAKYPVIGDIKSPISFYLKDFPKNRLNEIDEDLFKYEIIDSKRDSKYSGYSVEELNNMINEITKEIESRG